MKNHIDIFLVAAANPPAPVNLERTLLSGVSKERYQQFTEYQGDDPAPIWGIREGGATKYADIIKEGDILLFYTGDNPRSGQKEYSYMATVQSTEWNIDLSKDIWVDKSGNPGVEWPFIQYLSNVTEVSIPSRTLHDDLGYSLEHLQDFRRVTDERLQEHLHGTTRRGYLLSLSNRVTPVNHDSPLTTQGSETATSDRASIVVDRDEQSRDVRPPRTTRTEVSRTIRNTALVKQLKKEHNHRCQVCGSQRQGPNGEPYAEGHHLHPLGDDPPGPDVAENIIILCPNHHADFDYNLVNIDPKSLRIEHAYESFQDPHLRTVSGHEIGIEYLQYNNRNVG